MRTRARAKTGCVHCRLRLARFERVSIIVRVTARLCVCARRAARGTKQHELPESALWCVRGGAKRGGATWQAHKTTCCIVASCASLVAVCVL